MRMFSKYSLLFSMLSLTPLLAVACSTDSAPAACAVGEQCSCFSDSDCPDPLLESCDVFAGVCVGNEVDVPDAVDDVESGDTTDASEDMSSLEDTEQDVNVVRPDSAFSDIETDALVARNTATCEEFCTRQLTCGVPDFEEESCTEECLEFQEPIQEFAGESIEGRDCLEALVVAAGCVVDLDCEDVLDYAAENNGEHCADDEQEVNTICGPIFDEIEAEQRANEGEGSS